MLMKECVMTVSMWRCQMSNKLNITPHWEGVYRWLMQVKRFDADQYDNLIKTGEGEWEKLLLMAKTNKWGDNK